MQLIQNLTDVSSRPCQPSDLGHCAQVHRRVPVSLMLGVSTSPSALEALLPLQAVAALRPHHFHLTPAMARAESLYSEARARSPFCPLKKGFG